MKKVLYGLKTKDFKVLENLQVTSITSALGISSIYFETKYNKQKPHATNNSTKRIDIVEKDILLLKSVTALPFVSFIGSTSVVDNML